MKKHINKILGVALLTLSVSVAHGYIHPEGRNYVALKGNLGWAHNLDYTYRMPPMVNKVTHFGFNYGHAEGLALGSHLPNHVRVEIEAMHRRHGHKEEGKCPFHNSDLGHSTLVSLMGNVYWDLPSPVFEDMAFYIGGGVGPAWSYVETKHGKYTMKDEELVLAFQVMPGISFQFNEFITTFVGYKLFGATTHSKFQENMPPMSHIIDFDDSVFLSHNIEAGVRFTY